jgi:hypothetical protein
LRLKRRLRESGSKKKNPKDRELQQRNKLKESDTRRKRLSV